MSRLQQYILNEEEDFDEIKSLLLKNCKPFLRDWKKRSDNLYLRRVLNQAFSGSYIEKTARKNRKPRDTHPSIHNYWDKLFQKKFGWKARSEGVFAWITPTTTFYRENFFFPIGKYKILYSPNINDLYVSTEARELESDILMYNKNFQFESIDQEGYYEYRGKKVKADIKDLKTYLKMQDRSFHKKDLIWIPSEKTSKEKTVTQKYEKIDIKDFMSGNRVTLSIVQIKSHVEDDEAVFYVWKDLVKQIIERLYKETTIDKISVVLRESMVKCDKYYVVKRLSKEQKDDILRSV
jgi:hypothetical protein